MKRKAIVTGGGRIHWIVSSKKVIRKQLPGYGL